VAGPGGVLVGTVDGGVHADGPLDLPDRVGLGLGVGQQPVPGAVLLPAAEALVAGLPGPVAFGQVPPGCAGPQSPQDAVDGAAVIGPLPTRPAVGRQQWFNRRPRLVGQLTTSDHEPPSLAVHRTSEGYPDSSDTAQCEGG
jgi:hypothetical protein